MNNAPRKTLRELVARDGPGLCSDVRRCEGLLRDLCGEHRREVNMLVNALKERVPLDLLAAQGSMPHGLLLTRLAKRLEEHLAVTEEAARWAVDSWALALGVVTDAEVAEREKEYAHPEPKTPSPPRPADDEARKSPQGRPTTPAPPPPPPRRQQTGQPPVQTQPPPARPPGRPPPTRAPAQASPPPARRRNNPFSWPRANAPARTQADPAQTTPGDYRPPGLLWSLRGCVLGCFLLVLLSFVLFVGVPFVLSVLREEQQQRNLEPAPVRTQ